MDTNQILTQAQVYLGKFIDAAVPVAKQAYEIGLLTIQIDALQTILGAVLIAVASFVLLRFLRNSKAKSFVQAKAVAKDKFNYEKESVQIEYATKNWTTYSVFDAFGWGLSHVPSLFGILLSTVMLCNIWLWVKLFKPELWLAKQAIVAATQALTK